MRYLNFAGFQTLATALAVKYDTIKSVYEKIKNLKTELTKAIANAGSSSSSSTTYTDTQIDEKISAAITALIASAPEQLDTLNELSKALNNDVNFATTITNAISNKADVSAITNMVSTTQSDKTIEPILISDINTLFA